MKLAYMGLQDPHNFVSVGFDHISRRQLKLWDTRNTAKEVFLIDIDTASGAIMPFFDPDTCVLYLAGKGDGNIRYYEVRSGQIHPLSEFRSTSSTKGLGFVPKT